MKTVSLELAEQLKEAGYPQQTESLSWYWGQRKYPESIHPNRYFMPDLFINTSEPRLRIIALAPTADEILDEIRKTGIDIRIECFEDGFKIWDFERAKLFSDISLADAAAKCWLYLKENKMVIDKSIK